MLKQVTERYDALSCGWTHRKSILPNCAIGSCGELPEETQNILKQSVLHEGYQPIGSYRKKYDIIDFELGNKITGAALCIR
jgi:hypothetical protein